MTLTVLSGWSGIDDKLSGRQLMAIAVVFAALTLLATTRIHAQAWHVAPLIIAIGIAFAITSYPVVDGIGVRQAGSALGSMGWLSLGLSLGSAAVLSVRADVRRRIRQHLSCGGTRPSARS